MTSCLSPIEIDDLLLLNLRKSLPKITVTINVTKPGIKIVGL